MGKTVIRNLKRVSTDRYNTLHFNRVHKEIIKERISGCCSKTFYESDTDTVVITSHEFFFILKQTDPDDKTITEVINYLPFKNISTYSIARQYDKIEDTKCLILMVTTNIGDEISLFLPNNTSGGLLGSIMYDISHQMKDERR